MSLELFSKRDVEFLFKNHGVKPSRSLGQNFLIDKTAVKKIITACDLQPNNLILEIGPGPGILTQELAKRVKKVVAVEKDQRMIEILVENLQNRNNVEIVRADIRKIKPEIANYKVVGNLPFYLVAPVIRKFLELPRNRSPRFMVLVTQKEVAQRICAKPPDMN